jgi:hypothetical protein
MEIAQKQVDPSRSMPIWYLAGPFYQYEQDVKALARKAGVRIIDANVTASRDNAAPDDQLPTVTIKPQYKPLTAQERAVQESVLAQFRALSPEQQAAAVAEMQARSAALAEMDDETKKALEAATKAAAKTK